jgi:hypothetical protein
MKANLACIQYKVLVAAAVEGAYAVSANHLSSLRPGDCQIIHQAVSSALSRRVSISMGAFVDELNSSMSGLALGPPSSREAQRT